VAASLAKRYDVSLAESFPIRFGRYELVERLAIGGMAELFLATTSGEHGFAKHVVIKRLLPHLAREPGYTAMFIDEAKLTARLVHPKIAQTYELGRVGEQLFIAMEQVDGVDVLALLREYAHRRERLPVDLAVWIAHEVLDALDYAHGMQAPDGTHMGVVHRDISPSNVLLSRRGDVKLVDFGIARASEPNRHHRTKSGTLKGKYGYMSPEQVLEQDVDARSDLFSVGIVLAEMLMGRRLFAAPNELDVLLMVRDAKLVRLAEHGKHIEPKLDEILRKALRKDPADRFSTAGEMRDALDDWLYQQRLRVTPKKIADAVEGVYDQVWARRRATVTGEMPAVDDVQSPVVAGAVLAGDLSQPAPHPRAPTSSESPRALRGEAVVEALQRGKRPATSPDEADGIPRGLTSTTDSLPIVVVEESQPVLEVNQPSPKARPVVRIPPKAATVPPPVESKPVARTTPPPPPAKVTVPPVSKQTEPRWPAVSSPPPPATPLHVPGDDDLEAAFAGLELGESGDLGVGSEPPVVSVQRTASGTLDLDDLEIDLDMPTPPLPSEVRPPARRATGAPPAPLGQQKSVRYSSIEDAVSALSRKDSAPDPSTVDLDGSLVGERRRTGEMPALTAEDLRRAASKPPPDLIEPEDTPEENGDFTTNAPLKVLYRLMSTRRTGLLVAKVGAIKKEIYVRDGMPEYVSSNVSSELFGNWLVQQGVLSPGELAMALAMMPHYGGKLGDTLVGLGLMKPLEVFRNLTKQVRQKLIDVCTWSKGFYSWYANRMNDREAFPLDLNAFEVLGAGAMGLADSVVEVWYDRNRDARLKATKAGKFGPDRFELPGLRAIYDLLDGKKSVSEHLSRWTDEAERKKALRMIMLLEMCELARPATPTGAPFTL
jgi:serine/threonine-protein kinase